MCSFPCYLDGKPLFAQPTGDEGWVLIAEKPFAKLLGSYGALDGGLTVYALKALTGAPRFSSLQRRTAGIRKWDVLTSRAGDPVCQWRYDAQKRVWQQWQLVHMEAERATYNTRLAGKEAHEGEMYKVRGRSAGGECNAVKQCARPDHSGIF